MKCDIIFIYCTLPPLLSTYPFIAPNQFWNSVLFVVFFGSLVPQNTIFPEFNMTQRVPTFEFLDPWLLGRGYPFRRQTLSQTCSSWRSLHSLRTAAATVPPSPCPLPVIVWRLPMLILSLPACFPISRGNYSTVHVQREHGQGRKWSLQ